MKTNLPGMRFCVRAVAIFLVSGLFITFAHFLPTQAAGTFTVNSLADTPDAALGDGICADAGGQCTLRAAIQETNTNVSDTDTINFSVTGTINLTGSLPSLTNVIINGPGASDLTVRRDTGGDYRIFFINGAIVSISGLTVSNGRTPDGAPGAIFGGSGGDGGGIFATGAITLTDLVVTGNRSGNGGPGGTATGGFGGSGGGISSGGTVTMTRVTVTNNITGNGATGAFGGTGGHGGGIAFSGSSLTLTDCVVSGNTTGNGAIGTNPGASGGGGGDGAGINVASGTLNFTTVVINGNNAGDGNFGGTGGRGAGLFTLPGVNTTLTNVTISNNNTGDGGGGSAGQGGFGGGIENNGTMLVKSSTISGNTTGAPGSGGSGGSIGGGVLNNGVLTLINSTVSGNSTGGIGGDGGGIHHNGSSLTLTNSTITNNTALTIVGNGVHSSSFANPVTIRNTVIAQNGGGPDTSGAFVSQGNNLIGNADGSTGFIGSDLTGTTATPINAMLGPLANNGGPTFTHALLVDSPALDAGNNALAIDENSSALTQDQRGSPRIVDSPDDGSTATVDIGAFEFFQTFENIPDKTTNEDTSISISFNVGDGDPAVTSVTATSSEQAVVPDANIAVSGDGEFRTLLITPAANQSGLTIITLTINLSDGGVINDSFRLNVFPVNDAPTFTKGANQTVSEDAGVQTVNNWATNISAGPNEDIQTVSFTVTNDLPDLFAAAPAISASGTLTYMPAANRFGTATVTVQLKDNGGTAGGGQDTSVQTFTITVTSVNDAPINTVPLNPSTDQHTPLVFSTANSNAISVNDIDAGTDPIRITLTGTHGTVSLGSIAGIAFVAGDGVDDVTVTFDGTLAAINSALNGLTFKPEDGFASGAQGNAALQIVSDDLGHNGAGGAQTATSDVNIFVRSGGHLDFSAATFVVNENDGTVTITVLRGPGNAGTATVNFATSNGTATGGAACTSGVDYINTSGSLSWTNGDTTSKTFTITICNDGLNEENETVNLTLSNAVGTASLGLATATLTIGNDDAPVLLTEESTQHAIALDLVNQTRDPFSLTSLFNLSSDQRRRISLFVFQLGLLPSDTIANVTVVARDDEGRIYDFPVEALSPLAGVDGVTQVVVRLPDNVIGAPKDLQVKVTLRGPSSNEAFVRIAGP